MLFLNKNPAGKISNMVFGILEIVDGIVRVLTFGFIATEFNLRFTRWTAKNHIQKLKREREKKHEQI